MLGQDPGPGSEWYKKSTGRSTVVPKQAVYHGLL